MAEPTRRMRVHLTFDLVLQRGSDTIQHPNGSDVIPTKQGMEVCAQDWRAALFGGIARGLTHDTSLDETGSEIRLDLVHEKKTRRRGG